MKYMTTSLKASRTAAFPATTFGVMTTAEVISCFEADDLPGDFHHPEHVRLAFAYLSEYDPLEALRRFSEALKRYAAARGKADRYHETITYAYLFLIRERMARTPATAPSSRPGPPPGNWEEFAAQNPDLLQWKPGILERYYLESTLRSDLARTAFLFPDKTIEL